MFLRIVAVSNLPHQRCSDAPPAYRVQKSLASSQRADNTLQISSDLFRSAKRSVTAKTALILKSREFSMRATTDRIANEFAYEEAPNTRPEKGSFNFKPSRIFR